MLINDLKFNNFIIEDFVYNNFNIFAIYGDKILTDEIGLMEEFEELYETSN